MSYDLGDNLSFLFDSLICIVAHSNAGHSISLIFFLCRIEPERSHSRAKDEKNPGLAHEWARPEHGYI